MQEQRLKECLGNVFNIQSYCIHDGPGVRSTVFLKGCPLRCKWCQNPESQMPYSQLMYYNSLCIQCGKCSKTCPEHAIIWKQHDFPHTEREKCVGCGVCVTECKVRAREIAGNVRTAGQVVEELIKDKLFFDSTGGGITVSGGEPLSQPEFTAAILELIQKKGIHTAVETTCFASKSIIEQVFQYVDLGLCDIKHIDSKIHRELTGVPNEVILENITYIHNVLRVPIIIRTPVITNHNDDDENIAGIARFIFERLGEETPFHLLPYNKLGESKADSLEKPILKLNLEPPSKDKMEYLAKLARECGLKNVCIGG